MNNIPERVKARTAAQNKRANTLNSLLEDNRQKAVADNMDYQDVVVENQRRSAEAYRNKRIEKQNLTEAFKFNEYATKIGLGVFLSTLVENALLLDTNELEVKNPEWKKDIYETVMGIVENAELNLKLVSEMQPILEAISSATPNATTGILLTEDEVEDLYKAKFSAPADPLMDKLVVDVKNRAVNVIEKDRVTSEELYKELEKVSDKYEELKTAEIGEENMPENLDLETMMKPTIPVVREKVDPIFTPSNKKSILETLAVNKGLEMVREGKAYDGDLALADAIIHVTILEAFNTVGLLNVTDKTYADLIRK